MKKLLFAILTVSLFFTHLIISVSAEEKNETTMNDIYKQEISNAIICGTGTADDPYVLDYEKARDFENYILENLILHNYDAITENRLEGTRSGFVGNCLTVYKGTPSDGAVWVYSSGGMSVTTDGNIRIKKVSYNTVSQTHALAAAANYSGLWSIISSALSTYISYNKSTIASHLVTALTSAGISTIGGYSASSVAMAIAKCAGAGAAVVGTSLFAYDILNSLLNVSLNSASNSNKTYVHIDYITAYQGSWYEYSVGEAGWTGNKVYTPASIYGTGTYYSN